MSSTARVAPAPAGRAAPGALRRLTLAELRLSVRERVGFWGVAFPLLLLVIFGAIPGFRGPASKTVPGLSILDAYLPILAAFSIAMLAMVAAPSALAGYREKGVLRRLSTTPVGPGRVLTAQLIINVGMALVTLIALLIVARLAYHVPLPRQALGFAAALLLAVAALFGLGLLISAVTPTQRAASALGAILFFPLMFFAGLWLPIASMPPVLQHISHATPLGAAVQALTDTWQGHWPQPLQLLALAVYAVIFLGSAARLFRWE